MTDSDALAALFDAHRARLRSVAHRMLGSRSEADDAVHEAWLRLGRAGTSEVGNLGGWLTTVVSRICLDHLRSRERRREEPTSAGVAESIAQDGDDDPVREIELADSVGAALLVVLETLAPAERIAFVLHDLFGIPFEQIAPIVERTPVAARRLVGRARRRVRGRRPP